MTRIVVEMNQGKCLQDIPSEHATGRCKANMLLASMDRTS
jgi:hypothetical protein